MPANANSGRSSFRANHTTSFFLVSGFGAGAYSAKLLAGTKHRCSGVNQMRQCGDDMLRIFVTGGAPVRGGGGMPTASGSSPCRCVCVVDRGRRVAREERRTL